MKYASDILERFTTHLQAFTRLVVCFIRAYYQSFHSTQIAILQEYQFLSLVEMSSTTQRLFFPIGAKKDAVFKLN